MDNTAIECGVFILVFAGVCAAYALGRGARTPSSRRILEPIRRYSPPIEVVLEYRNESGFKALRRVRVTQSLSRPDGRLYLLGFCNARGKPRTFRVDRILCVATVDGEIIETDGFLTNRLGIPFDLVAAQVRVPKALPPGARSRFGEAHVPVVNRRQERTNLPRFVP